MNRLILKSAEFRSLRQEGWRELEGLLDRAERKGIRSLSPEELTRLPVLYRLAVSSLSVAQSIALDRNLLLYLENLALRGFLTVYGPRVSPLRGLAEFLTKDFAVAVRAARWHLLVAFLCGVLGVVAGYLLMEQDSAWFNAIVPPGLAGGRGPSSTRESLLNDEIFAPWEGILASFVAAANYLFTHNSLVCILIFSLGFAAGVPTVLLVIYQGLVLGVFVSLHAQKDLTVEVIGWLAIHGVTELTAMVLCGAAGLVLAEKMLFPGRLNRADSLAEGGRMAARIAIGAVTMLLVAGILEGGFRQLVADTFWRFVIGGGTGVFWLLYFTQAGRRR